MAYMHEFTEQKIVLKFLLQTGIMYLPMNITRAAGRLIFLIID